MKKLVFLTFSPQPILKITLRIDLRRIQQGHFQWPAFISDFFFSRNFILLQYHLLGVNFRNLADSVYTTSFLSGLC